jgi:uncharacterized protein (TIGR00375 family)
MRFIADLHVHSKYSRATSREMIPEGLWRWAQLKGIGVIGTGDFTHPEWMKEIKEKLEPAQEGLFLLKKKYLKGDVPQSCKADVSFMLSAEISSIYSKNGRTRKVHSLVLAPGFKEALEINGRLSAVGNLASDGRPILGLDARKLLEIVLDVSPDAIVVPAHAWTPHFSVFGAASGFDSLVECYEELTPHIHAIETGLSSDPPMNRRLSALDGITLVSNSDAHSPAKLGREANIFDTEVSYPAMMSAIKNRGGFDGTIEFFPEEGKYHVDGHRKCGVSMSPAETRKHNYICPACGRKLTIGVMHRVHELADRDEPEKTNFRYIIPFVEILAECMGRGVNTKGVRNRYFELLAGLGNEFHILLDAPLTDIGNAGGERLSEAVGKMRSGDVNITPGFDGEYGKVNIFKRNRNNGSSFSLTNKKPSTAPSRKRQGGLF